MPAIDYRYAEQSAATQTCKITEILLHNSAISLQPVLLPMIAQLSRHDRWLTLINPPASLSRELLNAGGACVEQILVLRTSEEYDRMKLASRALAAGTSHTVICWGSADQTAEVELLNQAAHLGNCLGILVRG